MLQEPVLNRIVTGFMLLSSILQAREPRSRLLRWNTRRLIIYIRQRIEAYRSEELILRLVHKEVKLNGAPAHKKQSAREQYFLLSHCILSVEGQ